MRQFYKKVDYRNRKAMVEFLTTHFRYHTLNSWNNGTTYANNIKIYNLGLRKEIEDNLYEIYDADLFWDEANYILNDFALEHDYRWQIGTNGRSSGYLVLYHGYKKPSGYKSFCMSCGQKNYTSIIENNNVCGKCHKATRVDFTTIHMHTGTYPGQSLDSDEDFVDFTMYELRQRVKLVQDFDRVADNLLALAVQMCRNFTIEEETYYVPKTRKVLIASA